MELRFIEDDTVLQIRINADASAADDKPKRAMWKLKRPDSEQDDSDAEEMTPEQEKERQRQSQIFSGTFGGVTSDSAFFVKELQPGGILTEGDSVKVKYFRGSNVYSFDARVRSAVPGYASNLVHFEQESMIDESSRRAYDRSSMRVNMFLHSVKPESAGRRFEKADGGLLISVETSDISAGGFGVVSEREINFENEADFLAEFSLGYSFQFMLPARMVRKGMKSGSFYSEYEYGFAFVFDDIPKEQGRLVDAIFHFKLSNMGRF